MKIIRIDNNTREVLHALMKENEFDRASTLDNIGTPVFDTALGHVQYVGVQVRQLEEQYWEALAEMSLEEIIMTEDLKLTPPALEKRFGSVNRSLPRYVEIPCLSIETERAWRRDEAERFADWEGGQKWQLIEQIKMERVPSLIANWLKNVGSERNIVYK